MLGRRFIYSVFCLLSVVELSNSVRRSFNVVWINSTCVSNPEVACITCGTEDYEDRAVINLKSYAVKNISQMEAKVVIDILREKLPNVRIVDTKIDGCKFLLNGVENNMIMIIYNMFQEYGTFPKRCPITVGHNYTLTNFYLDSQYLPPYTPHGTFRVIIDLNTEGTQLLLMTIFGKIASKSPPRIVAKPSINARI